MELSNYLKLKCPRLNQLCSLMLLYSTKKNSMDKHPFTEDQFAEVVQLMKDLKSPRAFNRKQSSLAMPNSLKNPIRDEMSGLVRNVLSPFFHPTNPSRKTCSDKCDYDERISRLAFACSQAIFCGVLSVSNPSNVNEKLILWNDIDVAAFITSSLARRNRCKGNKRG